MITSTYGVKIPEDGDQGPVVFPALELNAELFRDHVHTGSDSGAIACRYLTKGSVALVSGDWVATGSTNGWKQTVTCPTGYTVAGSNWTVKVTSGADQGATIYPSIVRQSATTFDVIVNDNALNLTILFV
jgi:hypothetical protein